MGRLNELRLIARVAQMYHAEGKRQAEIAEIMHMSQATVSRMLKRADVVDAGDVSDNSNKHLDIFYTGE